MNIEIVWDGKVRMEGATITATAGSAIADIYAKAAALPLSPENFLLLADDMRVLPIGSTESYADFMKGVVDYFPKLRLVPNRVPTPRKSCDVIFTVFALDGKRLIMDQVAKMVEGESFGVDITDALRLAVSSELVIVEVGHRNPSFASVEHVAFSSIHTVDQFSHFFVFAQPVSGVPHAGGRRRAGSLKTREGRSHSRIKR